MLKGTPVLLVVLLAAISLAEDFDPYFSYSDFTRNFPRDYAGENWTIHEAAFNKNYADLIKLHNEGKDVAINDRLDWTDE